MNFNISLDEFWLEEDDGEIEEQLKKHIIFNVTREISQKINDKVEKQITEKVNKIVESKLESIIDNKLSELIDAGTIVKHGKEVTIIEHVKDMFNQSHGWTNANDKLERLAKAFGNELKLQYNNAFANKIVSNMKEQGLLKDEVVQILLGGSK